MSKHPTNYPTSELVERLKWRRFPPDTKLSEDIKALGELCDEAARRIEAQAARVAELEAEVAELKRAIHARSYDAGFNDGLTGVYSADTTDPVMDAFHSPRLGNGAVPYAPIEEV